MLVSNSNNICFDPKKRIVLIGTSFSIIFLLIWIKDFLDFRSISIAHERMVRGEFSEFNFFLWFLQDNIFILLIPVICSISCFFRNPLTYIFFNIQNSIVLIKGLPSLFEHFELIVFILMILASLLTFFINIKSGRRLYFL
jgi:hypothetical protein